MCAWTHRADGKPISKNFQDRADYMKSGTAKIDIKKEHFRIQDSVSDPTAHSVVMATDKLIDNVPLTDQRGGPVTQLQLKDAVASVEEYLEYVDNNIVHNDGINGEEWISAQFFFYDKDANPAAETDGEAVEKELAQPVSISVGRTAAEECEWLWKNTPVQFEEACKEFGCTPEEMIALAEKDPEAYYKYRNAYGYGDEEFGCYACEAEVIDTPVNNIKDVTKLDNEGLGVARTDTSVGERLAAVEAGELGVLSRDTDDYEASITLRSPNIYDTTVLGLHEPEIHVHSKVGTSQVQRYFTFPTNGGVIATQPKAWTLIKELTKEQMLAATVSAPLSFSLSGYTEYYVETQVVPSSAITSAPTTWVTAYVKTSDTDDIDSADNLYLAYGFGRNYTDVTQVCIFNGNDNNPWGFENECRSGIASGGGGVEVTKLCPLTVYATGSTTSYGYHFNDIVGLFFNNVDKLNAVHRFRIYAR